jgi:hypothetical protein
LTKLGQKAACSEKYFAGNKKELLTLLGGMVKKGVADDDDDDDEREPVEPVTSPCDSDSGY